MKPADRLNILERGLTLHRAARFADALPLSCEMLAAVPDDPDALNLAADACLSLRDFTAAAGYLGKLAAGDLRDAQYRFNLGVALENSGRVDAAAIANLAGALAKMRAFNRALAIYDSAIQR
jgi:tetratricopeptide (TPR) repeat protein